jgi:hypothetical protein
MDPTMPVSAHVRHFFPDLINTCSHGASRLFYPDSPSAIVMRAIVLALGGTLVLSIGPAIARLGGDPAHERLQRVQPSVPLTPPSRHLVWGDVNIIHMALAYFWSAHLPYERMLSGDFGDFASFVSHMNDIAKVSNQIIRLIEAAAYNKDSLIGVGEGRRCIVRRCW